jgi:hypothetical protein
MWLNDDLYDTFTQFAQKCAICTCCIFSSDELTTDPSHPWQIVHKDCVYSLYLDSDKDPTDNHITGPNSKKRKSPNPLENTINKKQKK